MYSLTERRWKVLCTSCQSNSYDVKNLIPDHEYQFRVRAENIYGKSKPGHVSAVVRTRELREFLTTEVPVKGQTKKLVRRHSHHLKLDGGLTTLFRKSKTEESDFDNHVGTIPFRRNSSIRGSLPLQRRSLPLSASYSGGETGTFSRTDSLSRSNRDSARSERSGSLLNKRNSVQEEDDSPCSEEATNAMLSSLPARNRFSTASSTASSTVSSTSSSSRVSSSSNAMTSMSEEDDCNRSTSASSLMSIPEETDSLDVQSNVTIPDDDDFLSSILDSSDDSGWKLTGPWTFDSISPSQSNNDTLCAMDSDKNRKLNDNDSWTIQNTPTSQTYISSGDHSHEILSAPYTDDTKLAWCTSQSQNSQFNTFKPNHVESSWKQQNSSNSYNNNRHYTDYNSDSNGNYSSDFGSQCCVIPEDDEEMELVSAV